MNNTIERAIETANSHRVMIFIRKADDYLQVRATNSDTGKQIIKNITNQTIITRGNAAIALAIENAMEKVLHHENKINCTDMQSR